MFYFMLFFNPQQARSLLLETVTVCLSCCVCVGIIFWYCSSLSFSAVGIVLCTSRLCHLFLNHLSFLAGFWKRGARLFGHLVQVTVAALLAKRTLCLWPRSRVAWPWRARLSSCLVCAQHRSRRMAGNCVAC